MRNTVRVVYLSIPYLNGSTNNVNKELLDDLSGHKEHTTSKTNNVNKELSDDFSGHKYHTTKKKKKASQGPFSCLSRTGHTVHVYIPVNIWWLIWSVLWSGLWSVLFQPPSLSQDVFTV